jgi:malate dehydrogenase (oxaloacetate-decarboxylating)
MMAGARKTPKYIETSLMGLGLLNTPMFNKGTAFPESERDEFSLHGLLPPHVGTLDDQLERRLRAFRALHDDFARYTLMRDLQDVNETLFYAMVTRNIEEMLPVVYTPAVGEGCQRFSEIWRRPRGVFLSYPNRARMETILNHPRYDGVRCIVVSDGERILGLGDQGAGGMGIPIGKLSLYTALAGIHPMHCLPVLLDVGTDNAERIADPMYIGWRHERVRGAEYDKFVDAFVRVVRKRWPHVLLQWEDFAGNNAARLLERYRDVLPSFNDDIQGTAAVAVATLLAAVKVTGVPFTEQRFVVLGFGSAGLGITNLLRQALVAEGLSDEAARLRFYAVDKDGLLIEGMNGMSREQAAFARPRAEVHGWPRGEQGVGLKDVVEHARPTVLIGVSGQAGAFREEVVRAMVQGLDEEYEGRAVRPVESDKPLRGVAGRRDSVDGRSRDCGYGKPVWARRVWREVDQNRPNQQLVYFSGHGAGNHERPREASERGHDYGGGQGVGCPIPDTAEPERRTFTAVRIFARCVDECCGRGGASSADGRPCGD